MAGSVIFIVIVGAFFVFLLFYGRNGRQDSWLTWRIGSNGNGSFLRTLAVSAAGLIAGIALAVTHTGGFWAAALIIGAVIVPIGTAYRVTKNGGRLRWTWRTSDNPSDRGPGA